MAFKRFKKNKFTNRTASAGTKHKELYKKIPAIAREGKKAKKNGGFFDYDLVLQRVDPRSASGDPSKIHVEQDNVTKEVAVYMSDDIYRDMYNGFLKRKFGENSTSYQQISKSFFHQIGDSITRLVQNKGQKPAMLIAPFEVGSLGSGTNIIPPATASYKLIHPGIANSTTGKCNLVIINQSTNALYTHWKLGNAAPGVVTSQSAATTALINTGKPHLTRSFDKNDFHYIQPNFVPKWSFELTPHSNYVGGRALTASFSSSADFGLNSGSAFVNKVNQTVAGKNNQSQKFINYNGFNSEDGRYITNQMKGFCSGEGEFGLGETNETTDFFENKAFIYFPQNSKVQSGSYSFASESQNAAATLSPGSSTTVTLYYISGGNGPSGSYIPTSNFGNQSHRVSGSHIWLDATLTTPASAGYYRPGNSSTIFGCFSGFRGTSKGSAVTASIPSNLASANFEVPRFASSSVHS